MKVKEKTRSDDSHRTTTGGKLTAMIVRLKNTVIKHKTKKK